MCTEYNVELAVTFKETYTRMQIHLTKSIQDAQVSAELNLQVMQLVLDVNCSRSCQAAFEGHYTRDWIWKYSRKNPFVCR